MFSDCGPWQGQKVDLEARPTPSPGTQTPTEEHRELAGVSPRSEYYDPGSDVDYDIPLPEDEAA